MPRFATPLLAALFLTLPVTSGGADVKKAAPPVDVVLCLDVSGSMDDLIASAKVKLWDLVSELGKLEPVPRLRVGLYSYGHNGYDARRGWVRKEVDLTDDLDTVYQKLNGLRTAGPGSEEYVARVCRDAVAEQKWSADKKALRLVFVCGNEPADQDKQVSLASVAKAAVEKDVIINTIHCKAGGVVAGEAEGWRDLAIKAEGRFVQIDMKRGAVAVAAPQDKKIEELGARLNRTYLAYGKQEQRDAKLANQAEQDRAAAKAGAGAARSVTKATAFYRNSGWDLVDRLKEDPKFDVAKVPASELCDELKNLKPAERVELVKKKLAEREAIQKEIAELGVQRREYLQQATKKSEKAGDKAFDDAVRGALRHQAKKKGFTVPE